jgi:hypothetical protein
MAQYMTYDTTVDSDIWYFEGVFKMPYGAIRGGQDFLCSSNAPKAVIRGVVQAGPPASPERLAMAGREGYLRASGHLLGLGRLWRAVLGRVSGPSCLSVLSSRPKGRSME